MQTAQIAKPYVGGGSERLRLVKMTNPARQRKA